MEKGREREREKEVEREEETEKQHCHRARFNAKTPRQERNEQEKTPFLSFV